MNTNREPRILNSLWFTTTKGLIGIVIITDGYVEKAYIGIGNGFNQQEDAHAIAITGVPFPLSIAKQM